MKKMMMILTLLVGISFMANAQEIRQKSKSDLLPFDPSVKIGVLDNGLKYYIRENAKPKDRAELRIVVKAGSVQEDDDQVGLAHFIEHMCFNGTKNFPKNDLVNFLETTGMRFGADVNANTGFDRTYYLLTIPLDKPELLDKGFQVLEDWAHGVSFDQVELDKERGVILEEWRLYRGAQERIMKQHFPKLLYNSKFADRMPIGDTAVILNAPRNTFLRYYNEWYRPELMAVIAVGDFKTADIEKIIKDKFSRLKNPAKYRPRIDEPIPPHKETLVSIAKDKELTMPNISIYYKHPGRESSTYGAYRMGIIDNIVNNMFNNRLQELTRKAKPPFLYAMGSSSDFLAGIRAFMLISVSKTDEILKGMEAVVEEAYRMKKFGFTKTELERAKVASMKMIESAHAERDKTESADYAEEYYRNYYENEGMPGIDYELALYKEYVPSITIEEVNAYVATLVTDENKVIALSVPDKEGVKVPTENEVLAAYKKVAESDIAAYEDEATDKPLMAKKPTPGKVVETKDTKKFDIVEMKLSNGAKVIVKKTDFKNDEVLFRAWSKGGTSLVSDNDFYSASMADGIVDEGGISEFSATQLQKMLTGKDVRISPSISDITEGFDGSYSPQDAETFFQLLHLYFTAPRKDAETFESFVSRTKESIRSSKRTPESLLQDSMQAILGGYDMRKMPWTDKCLDKVDLDKAVNLFKERFNDAGDFTFIFVGAVDMDKLKNMLETYVASIPSKNVKENWKESADKSPKGPFAREFKKGIEPKSSVRLMMKDAFDYKPENILKLNAMMEVFNIRLREVIREDKGGVYGIGARQRINRFPKAEYSISIMFGTGPDRVQELIKAVNDVIAEMQKNTVSTENLTKAKEILTREFETRQKENGYWLNQIYNSDFNQLDIARLEKYNENVSKISAKDIQDAAKKYLLPGKMMQFVLNPED